MSYEQRLRLLKLPSLHYRRIHGDMIQMYKFITGENDPNCNLKLNFHSTLASAYDTRGTFLIESVRPCVRPSDLLTPNLVCQLRLT